MHVKPVAATVVASVAAHAAHGWEHNASWVAHSDQGWERNASWGLSTSHGWEHTASCESHSSDLLQRLQRMINSYDIRLFNELSQRTKEDQFGNRLREFQAQYETFAQRTGCLPWNDVIQRSLTRNEIAALTRACICTDLRLVITEVVESAYACEFRNVAQGSLHEAYATLGRRVNTIHRFQVGLHGNNEILSQYDELFHSCYSRFFEHVGEAVTQDLAGPVEPPQEENSLDESLRQPREPNSTRSDHGATSTFTSGILVVVELIVAAFIAYHVRRWHRLYSEQPVRMVRPLLLLGSAPEQRDSTRDCQPD